jgi:hypothetical protein
MYFIDFDFEERESSLFARRSSIIGGSSYNSTVRLVHSAPLSELYTDCISS